MKIEIRDVFAAMGGPRGIRRKRVGEIVRHGTATLFLPRAFEPEQSEDDRDAEARHFYTSVRPHLDGAAFDTVPEAVQSAVFYGPPRTEEAQGRARYALTDLLDRAWLRLGGPDAAC